MSDTVLWLIVSVAGLVVSNIALMVRVSRLEEWAVGVSEDVEETEES